ncbi:TPA: sensor histidine kinase, partial [Clostridioides difficile]
MEHYGLRCTMQIFVNKKIKQFFIMVLGSIIAFALVSVVLIALAIDHAEIYIMVSALIMGMFILISGYWYFREQSKLMEYAITQIKEYTSGNENARIECNNEGELYLLFHEVNSLVSILNAHAEKEMKEKLFLRDTLSDISHQLKTPLAALNVYNGIIQEETKDLSTIKDFTALSEHEL